MLQHVIKSNLEIDGDFDSVVVRNVLYSTICSNNVVLLDILFTKWQCEYSKKPDILQKVDIILPEVYEELRLKDVPLSMEIIFFVERRLIYSRFFSGRNENLVGPTKSDIGDVMQRIEMLCEQMDRLKEKDGYLGFPLINIDQEFFFIARFIAKNIRVLKRQLRSTYHILPWEEMEFCLTNFISIHTNSQEYNVVCKLVLDKNRLLNHLNNFASKLIEVKSGITPLDVNSKLSKQGIKDLSQLNSGTSACCQFFELYKDYEQLKNVYSLTRIERYIKIATSINLDQKKEIGKFVIERALQVMGESLKNTLESPHLSGNIHDLLLCSAPKNVRENTTCLRDLLSHSHTLSKKIELENGKDHRFFHKIQNDLIKIEVEISNILYKQNVKAIGMFLHKIINSKDLMDIKLLASDLGTTFVEREILGSKSYTSSRELEILKKLIVELSTKISGQTETEENLFKRIQEILVLEETKLEDVKESFVTGLATLDHLMSQIRHGNNIDSIKKLSHMYLNDVKAEASNKRLGEVVQLVLAISKSVKQRLCPEKSDTILMHILKILHTIEFEAGRVKAIDEFKESLEKDKVESQSKAQEEIRNVLIYIEKRIQDGKQKKTFSNQVRNKQRIHETKLTLIDFFQKKSKGITSELIDNVTYSVAVKRLNLNSKNEKKLLSCYENAMDTKKGTALVQQCVTDSYGKLVADMENLQTSFSLETKRKSVETFLKSLKLADPIELERILNDVVDSYKRQLQTNFNERLDLLKQLLPSQSQTDNFDFMQRCNKDSELQIAIEMLVLDLTEIIENVALFEDNALLFDSYTPVLVGKSLRNYLAHGDALVDVLPYSPVVAVVASAIKLVEVGNDLITTRKIVGHHIVENLYELKKHFNWCLNVVRNQTGMFFAAQEGNIDKIKHCIGEGGDVRGRGINRSTGLHYAARRDSLGVVQFFLSQHLGIDDEDIFNQKPRHIAVIVGSSEICNYFLETKEVFVDEINCGKTMLFMAAQHGQDVIVQLLIDKGANVETPDSNYVRPLHVAAENGYLKVVEILLHNNVNVNVLTRDNETPLYFASQNGHVHVVEALLNNNANVVGHDNNVMPLVVAANCGHASIVKALLATGISIDCVYTNNWSLMHYAAKNGFTDVVDVLLDKDINVNATSTCKWTPLHLAAKYGHTKVIQALLAKNAHVNVSSANKITPLHWASENGHLDAVIALVEDGADVNASSGDESSCWTSLHFAVSNGHKDVAQVLLRAGATVDVRDKNDVTPLLIAANQGFSAIVTELLLSGANVNASNRDHLTPLYVAATNGHRDLVVTLLDQNACVDAMDKNNNTPLHVTAERGHNDVVTALLDKGANIDASNNDLYTPLHLAAKSGHIGVVLTLLSKGASADAASKDNMTPLLVACAGGHKQVVGALLKYGADVGATSHDHSTVLHEAAATGHKRVVELLLNHVQERQGNAFNQFINAPNKANVTPLHVAALGGHKGVVAVLLGRGADVDAKTKDHVTPLYLATFGGYRDVVEMLLEKGANFSQSNIVNVTPLHVAAGYGFKIIVETLIDYTIKKEPEKLCGFINAMARNDVTPLHMAAEKGSADVVDLLLRNEANVRARTKSSRFTPLHNAALAGHKLVVEVLLNHVQEKDQIMLNEFVNALGRDHWTPLHLAAGKGHTEVALLLVEKGADVNAKNVHNITPLDLGIEHGHSGVVDALLAKVIEQSSSTR